MDGPEGEDGSSPTPSFSARPPHAPRLAGGHRPENRSGESGALARLHGLDGRVLLLTVDYGSITACASRGPGLSGLAGRRWPPVRHHGFAADGVEEVTLIGFVWPEEGIADLRRVFETRAGTVAVGPVGISTSRLRQPRDLVDFGARWIESH